MPKIVDHDLYRKELLYKCFDLFVEKWRMLDYTAGKNAVLLRSGQQSSGRVIGIDENGLLIMSINGESRKFSSGELSLRLLE